MVLPRFDPLPAFNFIITLIDTSSTFSALKSGALGLALGGFSDCTGLESSLDTVDYREGGVNDMEYPGDTLEAFRRYASPQTRSLRFPAGR